jgi:predicted metal-dependent peptidase
MHPALQHHTRRGGRNPRCWNMACDYAINPMLLDAGLTLPKDVLLDNRFRGMSAERIYSVLEEDEQDPSSSNDTDTENQNDTADSGGGSNSSESSSSSKDNDETPSVPETPGGIGQVLDAPEPENGEGASVVEQARDWQIAVEQAENVAKLAGKLPAGVTRNLETAQAADVDWRELLRRACRRPFRLTTVGLAPTAAMRGTVSTCQASSAKVSGRSVSRLTAPGPSTHANSVYSRPRSARSSPVNSLDSKPTSRAGP